MTQSTTRVDVLVRARFFHGLADSSRLSILDALRGGEKAAGQVASAAGLTVSNASRHLACLKDCGLVEARRDWRRVHYRLAQGVAERVAACERPEMAGRA